MATILGYSNFNGKLGSQASADLLYDILEKSSTGGNGYGYYKIRLYGYIRSWNSLSGSGSYATFYINGVNSGGFSSITANQYSEVARRDVYVYADSSGNCTLNWSLLVDTSWSLGDASKSGSLTLDSIPQNSYPSVVGDGTIGKSLTINTNRKATFTHKLYYSFGSIGQTLIASDVGDSYSWTVPKDLYAQIPNNQDGTGTIYCETYSGSTKVGDTQTCSFKVYVDTSDVKPTVALTVTDTNSKTVAVTGDSSKLVKYMSTASIKATVTTKYSATLKSVSITAEGSTTSSTTSPYTRTISNISNNSISASTTDSRGLSGSASKTPTMVNYVKLTCNPTLYRPSQTGSELKLKVSGNYFNDSFGKSTNTLTLKYRYREKGGTYGDYTTITPTISNNTYTADISIGTSFNYQKAYEVEISIADLIDSKTPTTSITKGVPILWIGEEFIEVFGVKVLYKS